MKIQQSMDRCTLVDCDTNSFCRESRAVKVRGESKGSHWFIPCNAMLRCLFWWILIQLFVCLSVPIIRVVLGSLGTPWDTLGPFELHGTPWNLLGTSMIIGTPLDPFYDHWDPLGPLGRALESLGTLLDLLGSLGTPRDALGPLGMPWDPLGLLGTL